MNHEMINHIRREVPKGELLAQLAEEAVELAHAALKLRRTFEPTSTTNPTPVTPCEAVSAVEEEIADVLLLLDLVGFPQDKHSVVRIQHMKLARWVRRLHAAKEETDK